MTGHRPKVMIGVPLGNYHALMAHDPGASAGSACRRLTWTDGRAWITASAHDEAEPATWLARFTDPRGRSVIAVCWYCVEGIAVVEGAASTSELIARLRRGEPPPRGRPRTRRPRTRTH